MLEKNSISGVSLAGIATCIPENVIENSSLVNNSFEAKEIEKISKMIGVKQRHVTKEGQTMADLSEKAALELLSSLNLNPEDIGGLIVVTQTPEVKIPAQAAILQNNLKLPLSSICFDINLGCSGYIYGLFIAGNLSNSIQKPVLLIAGDTSSKICDPKDKATAFLFGDAGSATIINPDPQASSWDFVLGTDGSGWDALYIAGGGYRDTSNQDTFFRMKGEKVFEFTLDIVPKMYKTLYGNNLEKARENSWHFWHQANAFILNHLIKKLKLPTERVPVRMEHYGNTSSGSIPLTICDVFGSEINSCSERVNLCGFGIGLSWGLATITLNNTKILPVSFL
ncbi:MAG: ketoacyl-ACP synthase III [Nitrospinae bacterium]|nr:ketoacyl-ACP synthase III [Nitrospinota bacterium]